MLQFYICYKNYYATLMQLEKLRYRKTNMNFRDQVWKRPPTPPNFYVSKFYVHDV